MVAEAVWGVDQPGAVAPATAGTAAVTAAATVATATARARMGMARDRRRAGAPLSSTSHLARSCSVGLAGPRARRCGQRSPFSASRIAWKEFAVTGGLYSLGRVCVRHRWVVLGVWLVVFVGARRRGRAASGPTSTTTSRCRAPTARRRPTCSRSASRRRRTGPTRSCSRRRRARRSPTRSTSSRSTTPSRRSRRTRTSASATSPLSSGGAAQLAKDETIGYIALNLKPSPSDLTDRRRRADRRRSRTRRATAGLDVGFGGYLGQKVSKPETHAQRGRSASAWP